MSTVNFNEELEYIYINKLKNIMTEMENTLEGIKSRLGDTEEHKWSGRWNNGNHPMGTEKKTHKF